MAHDVRFSVPERPLSNADVEFKVYRDSEKFGTLRVSKGAAVWYPQDGKLGLKMSWAKLDSLFKNEGRAAESRRRAARR